MEGGGEAPGEEAGGGALGVDAGGGAPREEADAGAIGGEGTGNSYLLKRIHTFCTDNSNFVFLSNLYR